MKYKDFSAVVSWFPFHKKKFIRIISICLLAVCFALPAVAANDDVRQIEPGDSKQLIKQAEKLTRKGKLEEAEKILRGIVERNSKDTKAKLVLGYVLLKQRRILEAYDFSIAVAKAEPKNSYAFAVLGATLLSAGNFRDAKLSFFNSIKLNNREALAWSSLGMLDFYENRITQGLDKLREAVYLEPQEPDYMLSLIHI